MREKQLPLISCSPKTSLHAFTCSCLPALYEPSSVLSPWYPQWKPGDNMASYSIWGSWAVPNAMLYTRGFQGLSCVEQVMTPYPFLYCFWLSKDLWSENKDSFVAWLFCTKHFLTTGPLIAAMWSRHCSPKVIDEETEALLGDLPEITQLRCGRVDVSIRYSEHGACSTQAV